MDLNHFSGVSFEVHFSSGPFACPQKCNLLQQQSGKTKLCPRGWRVSTGTNGSNSGLVLHDKWKYWSTDESLQCARGCMPQLSIRRVFSVTW